jgi:hypothetical protein
MTRWSDTPGVVDLIRFLVWKVHCRRCLRKAERARTVGTWKAVEAKLAPTAIGRGEIRWSALGA